MIKKKIKDQQVVEFLENNPNFFIDNPTVLSKVNFLIKHNDLENQDSKIVPFKDWIIYNLKNVKNDIIENARHNFFTQKKIHESVINILKINKVDEFFIYIREFLPKNFDLEVVNVVTSNQDVSNKYNLIFKNANTIQKIYGKKNQLILDAVDSDVDIFDGLKEQIYSNAIYSLGTNFFSTPSLLVFGSKDKHFLNNKAYDLVFFFSKVIQEKLNQFSDE